MFSMDDVPFAPGASPFRCKGILYLDAIEFFELHIRGGREALLGRMKDPALRDYLSRSFVVGGWYDLFPLLAFVGSAALATGQPLLETSRALARWTVPRQFSGIYKFLLKMASPEMTVRNLPRLSGSYFDFVRVEIEEVGPKTFTSNGSGVPAVAAPMYMAVSEVAIVYALECAGAKKARHRWLPQIPEGRTHGMDVVRVRRQVTWE